MPTVNIFHQNNKDELICLIKDLKLFLADKLTCGDIKLSEKEISVRLINIEGDAMIGNIELEIKAHAFKERIQKQDEICREVRTFIMGRYESLGDVRVWLVLSELGHSW